MVRRPRTWPGFRSVLCPIDFSDHSARALQYAATLALRGGAQLTALYVNDPLLVAAASAALRNRGLAVTSRRELRRFVQAHLSDYDQAGPDVKERVAIGEAPDQILKAARAARADLIVLGTTGLTGARRMFVGSTTLSVLQRTTIPVLAIPRADAAPESMPAAWPGRTIILAIELDGESGQDAEAAADIAAWFGSSLLLVHVIEAPAAPAWLGSDDGAHERIRRAKAQKQLDAIAVRVRKRVRTDVKLAAGNIGDEIAALAASERVDLVVTTLRDRRGWFGARRGSVSYHVLAHAVTPVLAIPSTWRRT